MTTEEAPSLRPASGKTAMARNLFQDAGKSAIAVWSRSIAYAAYPAHDPYRALLKRAASQLKHQPRVIDMDNHAAGTKILRKMMAAQLTIRKG